MAERTQGAYQEPDRSGAAAGAADRGDRGRPAPMETRHETAGAFHGTSAGSPTATNQAAKGQRGRGDGTKGEGENRQPTWRRRQPGEEKGRKKARRSFRQARETEQKGEDYAARATGG